MIEELAKMIHDKWSVSHTSWESKFKDEQKIWIDTVELLLPIIRAKIAEVIKANEYQEPSDTIGDILALFTEGGTE